MFSCLSGCQLDVPNCWGPQLVGVTQLCTFAVCTVISACTYGFCEQWSHWTEVLSLILSSMWILFAEGYINHMTKWITLTCAWGFFFIHNREKLMKVTVSTQKDSVPNKRNYNWAIIFKLQYANDIIADFWRPLIPRYLFLTFFPSSSTCPYHLSPSEKQSRLLRWNQRACDISVRNLWFKKVVNIS